MGLSVAYLSILALGDPGSCRCISLLYVGGSWDLVVAYHVFRCVCVCGGGRGPVSCRRVSWL